MVTGGVKLTKNLQPRDGRGVSRAGGFPEGDGPEEEESQIVEEFRQEAEVGAEAEGVSEPTGRLAAEDGEEEGEDPVTEDGDPMEAETEDAEVADAAEAAEGVGEEAREEEPIEEDEITEVATSGEGPGRAPSVLSEGSSKWWTPTDFYSDLPYQRDGIWAEEESGLADEIPDHVDYFAVGDPREVVEALCREGQTGAGSQDTQQGPPLDGLDVWKVSGDRAFVTIFHQLARRKMFVPSGIGFTIPPQEFRNERYTVCKQVGTGREVAFEDNWRERGATLRLGFGLGEPFWFFKAKNYPGWHLPLEKKVKETVAMRRNPMMRSQWKKVKRRPHLRHIGLQWSLSLAVEDQEVDQEEGAVEAMERTLRRQWSTWTFFQTWANPRRRNGLVC